MKFYGRTEIIQELVKVAKLLDVSALLVPTNLSEAKEEWFAHADRGVITNPIFEYDTDQLYFVSSFHDSFRTAADKLHRGLRYNRDNPAETFVIHQIYAFIRANLAAIHLANAIANQDGHKASECALELFGAPRPDTIDVAEQVAKDLKGTYRNKAFGVMQFYSDYTVIKHFRHLLDYIGIDDWNVVSDSTIRLISFAENGQILVSKRLGGLFYQDVIGLGKRFINSHLLGMENVRLLIRDIIGPSSPLAPLIPHLNKSTKEDIFLGVLDPKDIRGNQGHFDPYSTVDNPWHTLAIEKAFHGRNFAHTAEYLIEQFLRVGCPEDSAYNWTWNITQRIYRGSWDTAENFCVVSEDTHYFEGRLLFETAPSGVQKLCRHFSSLDYATITEYADFLSSQKPTYTPLSEEELNFIE